MGTGPPPEETARRCGSGRTRRPKSREQAPRPSGQGRRSAGRPLLDQARRESCVMTHITPQHSENRCGTRFAGCGSGQGNGWRWRWRHDQGIRQRTAGAMTSTDNSRSSDPSRSRIRGMQMESRSRESYRELYAPAKGVTGRYRPAGLCLSALIVLTAGRAV